MSHVLFIPCLKTRLSIPLPKGIEHTSDASG